MKDYYYILGIKENASSDEIKKAYRKLSLKFHPDKNAGDEFFTERFKEIQEAYETLVDVSKRKSYDHLKFKSSSTQKPNTGVNFNPDIEYFVVNKQTFKYDEEITFSWKTINSDKVTLKPFGSVLPIGEKTYKIKNFKNSTLNFELIAENTNIGRYTKQSLTLKNKTYDELYHYFQQIIESDQIKRTNKKTENSNRTTSKPIGVFQTDKGEIEVELNIRGGVPAVKNKVYQNGTLAKDGKYKLGFMNYIIIKKGVVIDFTLF